MTIEDIHTICWPAFIHFDHDPELLYLLNPQQWEAAQNDHPFFEAQDRLIDSKGRVYSMTDNTNLCSITLEEILGLIKAHLSDQGACCVAKLYAPTIEKAFELLKTD